MSSPQQLQWTGQQCKPAEVHNVKSTFAKSVVNMQCFIREWNFKSKLYGKLYGVSIFKLLWCTRFSTPSVALCHPRLFTKVKLNGSRKGSRTYARRHFARVGFARRQKPAGHIPVVAECPSTKCPSMTKARQFLARWILCPLLICPFLFSYRW